MTEAARPPPRVGLVEDDPLLRQFYSSLIQLSGDLNLAFAAASLAEASAAIDEHAPDLCLVDVGLPDGSGIDLVRTLKRGGSRVLILTVFADRATVMASLRAGADGYVLKSAGQNELLAQIRQTLAGQSPISPQIAVYMLELFKSAELPTRTAAALTQREVEVLSILARGLTYDETAAALGVSANTVRDFIKKIYVKLDVHTRTEALYEAAVLGVIGQGPKTEAS
jgi:DNA-binding NarL/FixJ family response regulator